jgi:hypothetical protein
MSKSAVFARRAFFSNLKMLEKCVELAHKILYVLRNGRAFLSMLGKAPSKPTKAKLGNAGIMDLGLDQSMTLRSQKFMFKRDFGSL